MDHDDAAAMTPSCTLKHLLHLHLIFLFNSLTYLNNTPSLTPTLQIVISSSHTWSTKLTSFINTIVGLAHGLPDSLNGVVLETLVGICEVRVFSDFQQRHL
jgi:hypothetical protein